MSEPTQTTNVKTPVKGQLPPAKAGAPPNRKRGGKAVNKKPPGPASPKNVQGAASNAAPSAVGPAQVAPAVGPPKVSIKQPSPAPVSNTPSPWIAVTQSRDELMKVLRKEKAATASKNDVLKLCAASKLSKEAVQATLMRYHNTEALSVSSPVQQVVASTFGQKTRMKESPDFTTHPKAQVSRKIAERCLMMCLVGDIDSGTRRFVDYYGSSRLAKRYSASCWPRRPEVPMVRYSPALVPKDTMSTTEVYYKSKDGDVPIFEDVYITPERVMEIFEEHNFTKGYIIMCEHDSRFLAGAAFEGEGVWYNNDGTLVQYSAAGETAWAPTPFCDDWFSKQFISDDGMALMWNVHRRVMDYALITVRYAPTPIYLPKDLPRPFTSNGLIIKKTINRADMTWKDWCSMYYYGIEDKELLCFWPAIDLHRAKMTGKSRVGHQLSQITSEVETLVSSKEYRLLWTLGLFDKSRVVTDTVYYLAWDGIHRECDLAENAMVRFGGLAERFKKTKMSPVHTDPKMSAFQLTTWIVGILGIISLVITDWLRMRAHKHSVIAFVLRILKLLSSISKLATGAIVFELPVLKHRLLTYCPMVGSEFAKAVQCRKAWAVSYAAVYEEIIKMFIHPELFGGFEALTTALPLMRNTGAIINPSITLMVITLKVLQHQFLSSPVGLGSRILRHVGWNLALSSANPVARVAGAASLVYSIADPFVGPAVESLMPRWLSYPIVGAVLCGLSKASSYPTKDPAFDEGYSEAKLLRADEHPEIVQLTPGALLPANRHFPGYEFYADKYGLAHSLYDGRPDTTFVYELLTTTSQFHRPAGLFHFLRAYETRNLSRAPITETCEREENKCSFNDAKHGRRDTCPLSASWGRAQTLFERELRSTLGFHKGAKKKRDEWAKDMNGAMKKNRAKDANELRKEGIMLPKSDVFLKGDEVLYPRPDGLKGRVVKAIHPTIQSECSVEILRAMKLLKRCFHQGVTHRINGWEYDFSIGSGKTSTDLSCWFDRSLDWVRMANARCAAIFAGDDLFIITRVEDVVLIVENDMSKMDRTNGVHALASEARGLAILGLSKRTIGLLFKAMDSVAVYEEKYLQFKLRCVMPTQRATGAADTTFGNTYVSMVSGFDFLSRHTPTEKSWRSYASSILKLGFEGKTQVMDFGFQGTFLKGWWVPTIVRAHNETMWLPLPSQVIKLGKILTNPTSIFRKCTDAQAWARAATAIAKGVGAVPWDYPILGPFLHKMLLLADIEVDEIREQDHKIKVDMYGDIDRAEAIRMYNIRYGLSEEQIIDVECLIRRSPFPARLSHVVFDVLAAKDYG